MIFGVVLTLCLLEWVFHVVLYSVASYLLYTVVDQLPLVGEERASFSAIVYM